MPSLPDAPLAAVLDRLDTAWSPWHAPHQWIYAMSGGGKTTLIREILARCAPRDRVLVIDPKPADDPSWTTGEDPPLPVTTVPARFGEHCDGGGPAGLWYRLTASQDPADTSRRFTAALRLVLAEGRTVLVLDDAHETCASLDLRKPVGEVLRLGRSAAISCIVATGDNSYVPKGQAEFRWCGHISGRPAAKAAAELLDVRGRDWEDTLTATAPYEWVYLDKRPGSPGACRTTVPAPALL